MYKQEKKLIEVMPQNLQQVREFGKICELEQPLFDDAWAALDKVKAEQFVYACSEYGLERREKLLKIIPRQEADREERIRAVLFRLNEQLPFTKAKVAELLETVSDEDGCEMLLDYDSQELQVLVDLHYKEAERLIREVLDRTLPAAILWDILLDYNKYGDLAVYTHEQLAEKTHYQIREEVLA